MKKFLLIVVMAALLCSCSAKEKEMVNPFDGAFSLRAAVADGDENPRQLIFRLDEQGIAAQFVSAGGEKGLSVRVKDGEVEYFLDGAGQTFPKQLLPNSSPVSIIAAAARLARTEQPKAEGDGYVYQNGTLSVYCEDGQPKRIELAGAPPIFIVAFKNHNTQSD